MHEWLFQGCVDMLVWLAGLLGVSYEALNVWLFCFVEPALLLALGGLAVWQHVGLRKLRRRLREVLERPG